MFCNFSEERQNTCLLLMDTNFIAISWPYRVELWHFDSKCFKADNENGFIFIFEKQKKIKDKKQKNKTSYKQ